MILLLFEISGKGTQIWKKSGAIYDGDWKDDLRNGYGTYSTPNTGGGYRKVYSGGWKNGQRHVCVCAYAFYMSVP